VLNNCIAIGEVYYHNSLKTLIYYLKTFEKTFNDPNPKYLIELNLKNIIYWRLQSFKEKAFGLKYKYLYC
jgi:hypothetical protein